ncbi:ATP-dependent DNA ligase [Paenibacillus cymbidii]|uniref:ATP-dependent DNA ligase n=1 Tax=Paenibacillus cymbidii TaxID=1639034 RepID=UPI0010819949|nr:RNA ligase family protein [Paenibacillus cymbidii]
MKLKPVAPFEPVSVDTFPEGSNWIAQVKWDGVRMLTYCDGREVRLINRRGNDRTPQYPEFHDIASYCSATSVILDGEYIAFDNNKPSFHEIMKRDSLRKQMNIALVAQRIPVIYMVFDVLYADGVDVTARPLVERQRLLESILVPQPHVQLVGSFQDAHALYELMRQRGMEGVVCKDANSTYAPGGKDDRWRKRKLFRDLVAVVGGVTHRAGTVNALLLGLYEREQGRLIYIGHAGAGKLTQEDWRELTERVRPLAIAERPFANVPERSKDATWLRPELTVKVQYLEWTPDGSLRHPIIQAFANVPPAGCDFNQGN